MSLSSMIFVAGMRVSPNREYSYLSRGMTSEDFERTLEFLGFDVAGELVLFVSLCTYVRLSHNFDVLAAGRAYFHHMHLRGALLASLITICINDLIQTLDHVGMDPTFEFAWLQN